MKNSLLTKIVLGASLLLAPAAAPDIGICTAPRAYAQEAQDEKDDFLEKRITNEIEGLQRKENKTAEEYIQLINISYDFKIEKTLDYAQDAEKNLPPDSPEHKYAKAMIAWLNQKQPDVHKHILDVLHDKKASPHLKSNVVLKFDSSHNKEIIIKSALQFDESNLSAYFYLFKHNYLEEINAFPRMNSNSSNKMRLAENGKLDKLISEYKKTYDKIVKKSAPPIEKSVYLAQIYKIFAGILTNAFFLIREEKPLPMDLPVPGIAPTKEENYARMDLCDSKLELRTNYFKLESQCYDDLLKIEPSYEIYMKKGNLCNRYITFSSSDNLPGVNTKYFDEACTYFDKACELAKKMRDGIIGDDAALRKINENIGKALYHKGETLCGKVGYLNEIRIRARKRPIFQRGLINKAIDAFKESLKYCESDREKIEERIRELSK